jgi:hypothetical protein
MRAVHAASGGPGLGGGPGRDAGRPRVADVVVEYEERYWYPDDGSVIWVAGHAVLDPKSGRYLARDAPQLAARGLVVCGVAGSAAFHDEVLQSAGVLPGAPLLLRRDADNEHDPHAIAVDVAGGGQLGWVPRDVTAAVAPSLDGGEPWSAVLLRERRASPRDPRTGVTMLLARAEQIVLHERGRRR